MCTKKIQVTRGIFQVYYSKALHNKYIQSDAKKIYLLILFSGSDYLHMYSPCKKHGLHIFTTVSYRKTTICKGKYCYGPLHFNKVYVFYDDDVLVSCYVSGQDESNSAL